MKVISRKLKIAISVAIILICILGVFLILRRQGEGKKILPYIPKQGEECVLPVFAVYENGTGLRGVIITFVEKDTGVSSTQTTSDDGVVTFSVIIGKTYEVTATFNSSTKTIMHTVDPWDAVSILISQDGEVGDIIFYRSGL
ncbi:MAG: hypothetical protein QW222_01540 [Candidatus Bathyarchaeia archaeon]